MADGPYFKGGLTSKPREDFYRGWSSYKQGFGDLDKEFWWGLENLWTMTSPRDRIYELRI